MGLSALQGKRGPDGDASARVWGGDLTLKHRPLRRAIYHSFELEGEILRSEVDGFGAHADERLTGGYLHARWQARRRWWLEGRFDRVERASAGSSPEEERWTGLVAFAPSEFSALRLEYATLEPFSGDRDHQLLLQLNFSIGPHPAHTY